MPVGSCGKATMNALYPGKYVTVPPLLEWEMTEHISLINLSFSTAEHKYGQWINYTVCNMGKSDTSENLSEHWEFFASDRGYVFGLIFSDESFS